MVPKCLPQRSMRIQPGAGKRQIAMSCVQPCGPVELFLPEKSPHKVFPWHAPLAYTSISLMSQIKVMSYTLLGDGGSV